MAIDPSSKLCAANNLVCLKNTSTKADADFKRITLLWYDGSTSKVSAPIPLICKSFPGVGNFSYNMEIEDNYGCKSTAKLSITVHPNVVPNVTYTLNDYCDSVQYCWTSNPAGGAAFNYSWLSIPNQKQINNTAKICATLKAGTSKQFKCIVENEFGCKDSTIVTGNAYLRKLTGVISGRKYCASNANNGSFTASENVTWKLNGKKIGVSNKFIFSTYRTGWNYITGEQLPPCKGVISDSFFITQVVASGHAYNNIRHKVIDTVLFENKSYGSAGTALKFIWSFNDPAAPACTTDRKKNLNFNSNCNFSLDQIARHYYKQKKCFVANLFVIDTISGCKSDTNFIITRYDYCDTFIPNNIVCLGNAAFFRMNDAAWIKTGGIRDTVFTDTGEKVSYLIFPGIGIQGHYYKTVGYKSPIFKRYYNRDTVWKEKAGKIIIDSFRNIGWISDTFFNKILVKYRPNAFFKLTPTSLCPPWASELRFNAKYWQNPDTIIINWGDTIEKYYGYTGDSALLPILKHTYKKAGKLGVSVVLKPKGGCVNSAAATIENGLKINFGANTSCSWRKVCFWDSIYVLANGKKFDASYGKISWDFGDGTFDSIDNPCKIYKLPGTYTIKLKAISKQSCGDSVTKTITLSGPVAGIKQAPLIYCSSLNTFYDSSYISGNLNGDSIIQYAWDFGDGTPTLYGKTPSHIYPSGGQYKISLKITTKKGCTDFISQMLKVLGPVIKAQTASDTTGCAPLSIKLNNLSTQCGNFIWQFGDAENNTYSTKSDTSVAFKYTQPGVYFVKLIGGDSFYNPNTKSRYYCSATYPSKGDTSLRFEVYPRSIADLEIPDSICLNAQFLIKNKSKDTSIRYRWQIDNSNPFDTTLVNLYATFTQTGTYPIKLITLTDSNKKWCPDTTITQAKVVMHPALFETDCKLTKAPGLYLKNKTAPQAQIYNWYEMRESDSSLSPLVSQRDLQNYQFDTGKHIICLYTTNPDYCIAPTCSTVLVINFIRLANVFTPGNDGYNDVFKVPFAGYKNFELKIFNRYGETVFISNDPKFQWNGKVNNTGAQLPSGTYFYQLSFLEDCKNKNTTITGSVNLLR